MQLICFVCVSFGSVVDGCVFVDQSRNVVETWAGHSPSRKSPHTKVFDAITAIHCNSPYLDEKCHEANDTNGLTMVIQWPFRRHRIENRCNPCKYAV